MSGTTPDAISGSVSDTAVQPPSARTDTIQSVAVDAGPVRAAWLIGYVGLLHFLVMSLWIAAIAVDHPWHDGTIRLLVGYGALVLSFLGGIRWGLAMVGRGISRRRDFALAVLPPVVGWSALTAPPAYAFVALAVAFAAQGAWDSIAAHDGTAPAWYGRQRTILTAAVVATMILAFIATSSGGS